MQAQQLPAVRCDSAAQRLGHLQQQPTALACWAQPAARWTCHPLAVRAVRWMPQMALLETPHHHAGPRSQALTPPQSQKAQLPQEGCSADRSVAAVLLGPLGVGWPCCLAGSSAAAGLPEPDRIALAGRRHAAEPQQAFPVQVLALLLEAR